MTYQQKILKDFESALLQFELAIRKKSDNNVLQAGCIQYFEFCFELAWKVIKVFADEQGISDAITPKSCLKQAFALEWITNEKTWLEMLESRNRMSHTYSAKNAIGIYRHLKKYFLELNTLHKNLKSISSSIL